MATQTAGRIQAALYEHLATLTLPATTTISFEAVTSKPIIKNTYLDASRFFENTPIQPRIAFGSAPIRQGLLQVDVVWPAGKGAIKPRDLADKVAGHFARGTSLTNGQTEVRIIEEPTVNGGIQEKDRFRVPVTIPWTVYPA